MRLVLSGTVTISLFALLASSAGLADSTLPDLPEAFDAGWKGEKTCQLLYETQAVRIAKCTFPPGIGHEKHFHYPHFGYVVEGGTMSITNEDGDTQVKETANGVSWSSDEITIHEALNIGETTTSYLIVEPREMAVE